jgi:adenylyltransferase/sulfurtransferase
MKDPSSRSKRVLFVLLLAASLAALALWQGRFHLEALAVHVLDAGDEIAPAELERMLDSGERVTLLDVREPWEWDIAHLAGARLTPVRRLEEYIGRLDPDDRIVLYCKQGVRSMRALKRLRTAGFRNLHSLAGGIDRWRAEIDPSLPAY